MRMANATLRICPGVADGRNQREREKKRFRETRTFACIDESGTELEGERVGSIDSEKHDTEGTTLPDSTLKIDDSGPQDVGAVKRVKHILGPKGVAGSNGRDDLLSQRTTLSDALKRFLHILGDELAHEAESDRNQGDDGGHGKRKFPLLDVCEDETGEESRQEAGSYWDLLGNTSLNQI